MRNDINDRQLAVLRWIGGLPADGEATNPQRLSARALQTRRLVTIKERGPRWRAELTPAGRHYLEHGSFPAGHFATEQAVKAEPPYATPERSSSPEAPARRSSAGGPSSNEPSPRRSSAPGPIDHPIDSPAGKRRAGGRPKGDALFRADQPDPYDEKVLATVKEAAWMLSLPEGAIRQAAREGDVQRVYIGSGTHNYRIVYGSLLAWVNDMPREPARRWW